MVSEDGAAALGGFFLLVLVLLPFLRLFHNMRKEGEQQQEADEEAPAGAGGGELDHRTQQQLLAAEVAEAQGSGPPLVCTYRRADGWREGSCGVCLSELADGDILRVLPACMHYFHAAASASGYWRMQPALSAVLRSPPPPTTPTPTPEGRRPRTHI